FSPPILYPKLAPAAVNRIPANRTPALISGDRLVGLSEPSLFTPIFSGPFSHSRPAYHVAADAAFPSRFPGRRSAADRRILCRIARLHDRPASRKMDRLQFFRPPDLGPSEA